MPMNSGAAVEVVEEADKCPKKVAELQQAQDASDTVDRSESMASAGQEVKKKTRKSLTSFSIFRRDKKFSESKIESPAQELAPRSTRTNLVLDNTRLEVGCPLIARTAMDRVLVESKCCLNQPTIMNLFIVTKLFSVIHCKRRRARR